MNHQQQKASVRVFFLCYTDSEFHVDFVVVTFQYGLCVEADTGVQYTRNKLCIGAIEVRQNNIQMAIDHLGRWRSIRIRHQMQLMIRNEIVHRFAFVANIVAIFGQRALTNFIFSVLYHIRVASVTSWRSSTASIRSKIFVVSVHLGAPSGIREIAF